MPPGPDPITVFIPAPEGSDAYFSCVSTVTGRGTITLSNLTIGEGGCHIRDAGRVVTPFRQVNAPWSGDIYDHTSSTMAALGCATTSYAMLLSSYGLSSDILGGTLNPRTLNDGLTNFNSPLLGPQGIGYTASGGVHWQGAALYARSAFTNQCTRTGGSLDVCVAQARNSIAWKGMNTFAQFGYEQIEAEICAGNPVILAVPSPSQPNNPNANHFVLAVGTTTANGEKTFLIQDPANSDSSANETNLNENYPEIRGVRRYRPAADPAMMQIYASQNVDFIVTDPQGRRMGRNPFTGETFNEIPGAVYMLEGGIADLDLSDGVDNSTPNHRVFENVNSPAQGTYNVQLFSVAGGSYTLSAYGFDVNGDINALVNTEGELSPGATETLSIQQSDSPLTPDDSQEAVIKIKKAFVRDRPSKDEDKVAIIGNILAADDEANESGQCLHHHFKDHRYCDLRNHQNHGRFKNWWNRGNVKKSHKDDLVCHRSEDREPIELNREVTLKVGIFQITIPASSFKKKGSGKKAQYVYQGRRGEKFSLTLRANGDFSLYMGNEDIGPDRMPSLKLELIIDDLVGKIDIGLKCKNGVCESR